MNFLLSLMSKLRTLSTRNTYQFHSTLPFSTPQDLVTPLLDKKNLGSLQTMGHSINSASPPLAAATAISSKSNQKTTAPSTVGFLAARHQVSEDKAVQVYRRSIALGLVVSSLSLVLSEQSATAAARRPPPPSPEEKKDPNLSGVQAKVLASKKRKEAMKDSIAKLREKGKPVD